MGIINPTPLEIHITFNEMAGTIDAKFSRPVKFPRVIRVLSALIQDLGRQAEDADEKAGASLVLGGMPPGGPDGGLQGGLGGGPLDGTKN